MKKIVALALSLVMALALCTTAFAANTYDNFYLWNVSKWEKQDLDGKSVSYTSASETKVDGKFVKGNVAFYTVDGTQYFEVASADATARLDVNGKTVYLDTEAHAGNGVEYTKVGTVVKSSDKCGEAKFDVAKLVKVDGTNGAEYYTLGGGGAYSILVDGLVRACNPATVTINAHKWDVTTTKDAKGNITGSAVCSKCGQKAVVTNDKSTIPSAATVDVVEGTVDNYVYYTAAGTTTTTTTTSPKTFDAGIAMYVGMSLMSVAGSAVVIGKKKEF